MLCGAYTLAQNAHVRGDFLYSSMRPRTQASLDLVLYIVFFLPGIAALIYSGYDFAAISWHINEHSNVTANGPPVYHFKTMIPIAGALVMLQGIAEIVRCVVCLKTGEWPSRLQGRRRDRRHRGAARAQRIRRRGIAQDRDRARQRDRRGRAPARHGRGPEHMSDPALGLLMLDAHRGRDHDGLPDGLHADGPRHVLRLHRVLRPDASVARQPGLRPDGPAHLRRDDQRRPDLHPAVRADGLRDGARRAGRQDVLLDPARVPARAGLARGRDADRVHVLGHCQRPGRRGRGADGRHRVQPDAAGRLRREARLRRHHRRRHARHSDSAVGHDHRLCGGRRAVGREALRGGDVPRLLPVVPLSRLHHRLGDD